MLKNKSTYEIMDAESIGLAKKGMPSLPPSHLPSFPPSCARLSLHPSLPPSLPPGLVLGKHSGRAAFRARLTELGYEALTDAELNKAFVRFKEVADKKKVREGGREGGREGCSRRVEQGVLTHEN